MIEENLKKRDVRTHIPMCLGPVSNLEEHVSDEWWKEIFNSFYLKTDADVVDDSEITFKEIDIFSEILNLRANQTILDLCCGQGRHSLEFAKRGYSKIEGIDRSRYLIQKAKKVAKKEGLSVRFKEGDARKLPYANDTFDVVMILGNSFGYFASIKDDFRVLNEVFRVLKPWGQVLIDITDGEYLEKNFQSRSWEWIDKNLFVCRERTLSSDKQRLISREVINHVNQGVLADQFYAERLYSKPKLYELLEQVGFSKVKFNREFSPESKRNQDLGMMEKRLLISAQVKKEWTESASKKKEFQRNVVVIMGDPDKPDALKPLQVFDDDDFFTIDQLKDALRGLGSYRFTYLNDHNTLIQDLITMRSNIDFALNLCDEGYYNDPRKELHVPALLEILDIPYTGANPQCLAFCYDKSLVRGIAGEMGIPVPHGFYIRPGENVYDFSLYFPAIVKPNFGDSSFGITQKSVVYNGQELITAIMDIREKFGYNHPVLVEQFLPGKDLTLGIIGNPPHDYQILPISEDDYGALPTELPQICGYEAKWLPDSPYWKIKSVPAVLPEETTHLIETCSLKLFERLECRDYARFDWRLDSEGNPKLLEVNPNPGWCWDGHLAKMAQYAGIPYEKMLNMILRSAESRGFPPNKV